MLVAAIFILTANLKSSSTMRETATITVILNNKRTTKQTLPF